MATAEVVTEHVTDAADDVADAESRTDETAEVKAA